jgi:hypothetical protein
VELLCDGCDAPFEAVDAYAAVEGLEEVEVVTLRCIGCGDDLEVIAPTPDRRAA